MLHGLAHYRPFPVKGEGVQGLIRGEPAHAVHFGAAVVELAAHNPQEEEIHLLVDQHRGIFAIGVAKSVDD